MDRPLTAITHDNLVELLYYRPDGSFYLCRTKGWNTSAPEYIELTAQEVRQWLREFDLEDQIEHWKREFNILFRLLPGIDPGVFAF